MGKAEGEGENWHGHVTAVTVRVNGSITIILHVFQYVLGRHVLCFRNFIQMFETATTAGRHAGCPRVQTAGPGQQAHEPPRRDHHQEVRSLKAHAGGCEHL